MINPDLVLWRTVIIIGLHDAANDRDVDWLGSDDFIYVCGLADMDPDAVLKAYAPERFMKLTMVRRSAA